MIGNIFKKVFGSRNSRLIKDYAIRVKKINDLEQVFEKKSDQELKSFTLDLKKKYLDSQNLNELLEEAYAAVREASKRQYKAGSPGAEPYTRKDMDTIRNYYKKQQKKGKA